MRLIASPDEGFGSLKNSYIVEGTFFDLAKVIARAAQYNAAGTY